MVRSAIEGSIAPIRDVTCSIPFLQSIILHTKLRCFLFAVGQTLSDFEIRRYYCCPPRSHSSTFRSCRQHDIGPRTEFGSSFRKPILQWTSLHIDEKGYNLQGRGLAQGDDCFRKVCNEDPSYYYLQNYKSCYICFCMVQIASRLNSGTERRTGSRHR